MTPIRFHSDTREKECAPLKGELTPRLMIYGNPLPNQAQYSIAEFQKNGSTLTIASGTTQVVEKLQLGIGAFFERVSEEDFEKPFNFENIIEGCLYVKIFNTKAKGIYRAIGSQVIWFDLHDTVYNTTHTNNYTTQNSRHYQQTRTNNDFPNYLKAELTQIETQHIQEFNKAFAGKTYYSITAEEFKTYLQSKPLPADHEIAYIFNLATSKLIKPLEYHEAYTILKEFIKDDIISYEWTYFKKACELVEKSWQISEHNKCLRKAAETELKKSAIWCRNFFEACYIQRIQETANSEDVGHEDYIISYIFSEDTKSLNEKDFLSILRIFEKINNYTLNKDLICENLERIAKTESFLNTNTGIKIDETLLEKTKKVLTSQAGHFIQNKIKTYITTLHGRSNLEKEQFLNFLKTLSFINYDILRYALNSTYTRAMDEASKREIIAATHLNLSEEEIQNLIPNRTEMPEDLRDYFYKDPKIAETEDAEIGLTNKNTSTPPSLNALIEEKNSTIAPTFDAVKNYIKNQKLEPEITDIINALRRKSQELTGVFEIKPNTIVLEDYFSDILLQNPEEEHCIKTIQDTLKALFYMDYTQEDITRIGKNFSVRYKNLQNLLQNTIQNALKDLIEKTSTVKTEQKTPSFQEGLHHQYKRYLASKRKFLSKFQDDILPFLQDNKDILLFEEVAAIIAQGHNQELSIGEIYQIVDIQFKNFTFTENNIQTLVEYNEKSLEDKACEIADKTVLKNKETQEQKQPKVQNTLPAPLIDLIKNSINLEQLLAALLNYFGTSRLSARDVIEACRINTINTYTKVLNSTPTIIWTASEIEELKDVYARKKENLQLQNPTTPSSENTNQDPPIFTSLTSFISYCRAHHTMTKEEFLELYRNFLKKFIPSLQETYKIFDIQFCWAWDNITMQNVLYENPNYISAIGTLS